MENKIKYEIEDSFPLLMSACSKYLREGLNRKLKSSGLDITAEQWIVLIHLWKRDGLSQQALADRFRRSKVAVFRLIGKLEERGLIKRNPNPDDARCNKVYLTKKGEKIMSEVIPHANFNKDVASKGIDEKDMEIFKKTLKKMIENLRA